MKRAGDRHAAKVEALKFRVLSGPGRLDPAIRAAAVRGSDLPPELSPYVEKVLYEPEKITDSDVESVRAAGYTEDDVFELTFWAALGAGLRRLEVGLGAVGER